MTRGEAPVAGNAAILDTAIDCGEHLQLARPAERRDRGLQGGDTRVVHRDQPTLRYRRAPALSVAEAEHSGQHATPDVQLQRVFGELDPVDVEPRPTVDTEGERQPVGEVDQVLVLDFPPRHVRGQPVVHAAGVGTRIVGSVGFDLRTSTPGGEHTVAQGAQCLAQTLLFRVVTLVDQRPDAHPPSLSARTPQELHDLIGIPQGEVGHRLAMLAADDDAYALAPREDPEGVLVGFVVTDVQRRHVVPIQAHNLEQLDQGQSLVPLDVRSQLEDLLAARQPELGMGRRHFLGGSADQRFGLRRRLPEVDGNGVPLPLHPAPVDGRDPLLQLIGRRLQRRPEPGSMLLVATVRAGDVETVASGVIDAG